LLAGFLFVDAAFAQTLQYRAIYACKSYGEPYRYAVLSCAGDADNAVCAGRIFRDQFGTPITVVVNESRAAAVKRIQSCQKTSQIAPEPAAQTQQTPAPAPTPNATEKSTAAKSAASATDYLGKGNEYYSAGNYAQAVSAYKAAIDSGVSLPVAYIGLANTYSAMKQYADAIQALQQALRLQPNVAATYDTLGNAYFDAGQYANGLAAFQQAVRLKPSSADFQEDLAMHYYMRGMYADSVEPFQEVIRLAPDRAAAYFGLGNTYLKIGKKDAALQLYRQLQAIDEDAAKMLLDNINTSDTNAAKPQNQAAAPTAQQSAPPPTPPAKLTPEQEQAIKDQNAKAAALNALIKQANDAMAAKNWQAAISPLQQLIADDPNNWQYDSGLGDAYLNLAQYDAAVQAYTKGAEIAEAMIVKLPKDPSMDRVKAGEAKMLTNQGNAYLKLKKNPLAIAAYTKAAALDPNPAVAYFNLCATQYNTGDTEGALTACDKAIAADPKKADAYFIKGSLLVAGSKTDANNKVIAPPGTAEALKKYLELAPDGAHADDVKQMLEYIGVPVKK
jgi:tetratricopeptide (TPR) repeat protein